MRKIALLSMMMLLVAPLALVAGEEGELPEGQEQATLEVSGMTCGDWE